MGKWSVRKRKGFDTPSLEEFLWYHLTPGGIYTTAVAEGGLESEEFDYYVGSGLLWFGSMAYALDAIAAAEALGTTNIAAEFAVARNVAYIRNAGLLARGAVRSAPILAAPITAVYVGQEVGSALFYEAAYTAGANVPASSTKPWFIPLPIWIAMH